MNGHEPHDPAWADSEHSCLREVYWRDRCLLAEDLLKYVFNQKELGRACHIRDLEHKVKSLKDEITHQRIAGEVRNRQLKAANLIVLCTGGCDGGLFGNNDDINEELIAEVERTAKRLRMWYNNYLSRKNARGQ